VTVSGLAWIEVGACENAGLKKKIFKYFGDVVEIGYVYSLFYSLTDC